jgi:hypothetical protein
VAPAKTPTSASTKNDRIREFKRAPKQAPVFFAEVAAQSDILNPCQNSGLIETGASPSSLHYGFVARCTTRRS